MLPLKIVAVFAFAAAVAAQGYDDYDEPQPARRPAPARINPGYSGEAKVAPTPVPILKQINRHNEDGSYTYGYEGADGSFKIETKLATGDVKGKYGYVDDTGKVRVVEYGATKYGFAPSGEGITVPPPTLVDESNKDTEDQYYEPAPAPRPKNRPSPLDAYAAPQQQYRPAPQNSPAPARTVIPGATQIEYVPQSRPPPARIAAPLRPAPQTFQPAPIQEEQEYEEIPAPRPPKITYAQPAPLRPAPARPAPTKFGFEAPAPARPQFSFDAPAPVRPAPPKFAPEPQYAPQPAPVRPAPQQFAPAPRPAPRPIQAGRGGILDQLSKDYALPQGGAAPLHDISFGYY